MPQLDAESHSPHRASMDQLDSADNVPHALLLPLLVQELATIGHTSDRFDNNLK